MKRSIAREHIFKILYEMQFEPDTDIVNMVDTYLENFVQEELVTPQDYAFILGEVKGVCQALSSLDEELSEALIGWKLERLSKVDLAILRLALYEIRCVPEIPISVSINEAVELAKKYSPQSAGRAFINGVLGKLTPKESV